MKFGGPVWHCSVAPQVRDVTADYMRGIAYRELSGMGDAQLGEWTKGKI